MSKLNGVLFEPRESVSGDYYESYPNVDFVSYRWVWLTSTITGLAPNARFAKYADDALLCLSNEYLSKDLTIPGMLSRSNGHNLYSTYGDYYFMFALAAKLYGIIAPWGNAK